MALSGWDGYGPVGARLCIKNLSLGVSPKSVAQELQKMGFTYVLDDHVNVVRKGSYATGRFCIAFVPMESWSDVDTAAENLKGRVVPSCSPKPLHAERAIPRMNQMAHDHAASSVQEKSKDRRAVEPEPLETGNDLADDSSGKKALAHLMKVKQEDLDYKKRQVTTWTLTPTRNHTMGRRKNAIEL
eukprot:s184_g33.t1